MHLSRTAAAASVTIPKLYTIRVQRRARIVMPYLTTLLLCDALRLAGHARRQTDDTIGWPPGPNECSSLRLDIATQRALHRPAAVC
jgi:hypothetical protein